MIRRFFRQDKGQGLVEFALIIVLIALVAAVIMPFVGNALISAFQQAADAFP